MKNRRLFSAIIILITICSSFQSLEAQEKTKEEKEKELMMQEAIKEQKKAMVEQQKILEEQKKTQQEFDFEMLQQKDEVKKALENVREQLDDSRRGNRVRVYSGDGARAYSYGEPFVFSAPDVEFFHNFSEDSQRTSWDFSKSIKENSFSRDYTFDVEPTVKNVVMAINGDCKAGEIRIKIVTPNGKLYSDIQIDEFGNLNWRKSFSISETENKDKAGAWKIEINSNKATGYFKISMQTF